MSGLAPRGVAHVDSSAELAPDVELGAGAVVHAGVRIGPGSTVGAATVIHPETVIGRDCLIEDGAILGKRPRLRRGSSAAGRPLAPLTLSDDVAVCAGAVVYAGARLGPGVIVGDQSQIREGAGLGERTVVGRGSTVDYRVQVGARVSIQTLVYVTGGSVVEDDVFIGPGVVMTNDDTMARHAPGRELAGATLRRACRIGGGVVLTPGIEIGEEAFIAAGAVVTGDVAPRAVVIGVPGRVVREVGDEDLLERWS